MACATPWLSYGKRNSPLCTATIKDLLVRDILNVIWTQIVIIWMAMFVPYSHQLQTPHLEQLLNQEINSDGNLVNLNLLVMLYKIKLYSYMLVLTIFTFAVTPRERNTQKRLIHLLQDITIDLIVMPSVILSHLLAKNEQQKIMFIKIIMVNAYSNKCCN